MIFDGAGAGSTRLGSRVREQVSVLKSVAFSVRFCAVRAFFSPYFIMRLEQTCLDMIFRRGGWGLDSGWVKGSGTGFGFEIRPIFDPNLRCSRQFAPILLISATQYVIIFVNEKHGDSQIYVMEYT